MMERDARHTAHVTDEWLNPQRTKVARWMALRMAVYRGDSPFATGSAGRCEPKVPPSGGAGIGESAALRSGVTPVPPMGVVCFAAHAAIRAPPSRWGQLEECAR
jgi:hypothetical protein